MRYRRLVTASVYSAAARAQTLLRGLGFGGMTAPAGWYPHPKRSDMESYWNGAAWTSQLRSISEPKDTLVTQAHPLAQSVIVVVSIGGWPALFGGHSEVKTITRAVSDANGRGLRVAAVTPDRWGIFRRLWAGLVAIVSLGFVVRKPNTLLICEPRI